MKHIKAFENFLNEANDYTIEDFPVGSLVHLDDEVWVVLKTTHKEVIMKPSNNVAKDKYVSVGISFDLPYLNGAVTKIEKKK